MARLSELLEREPAGPARDTLTRLSGQRGSPLAAALAGAPAAPGAPISVTELAAPGTEPARDPKMVAQARALEAADAEAESSFGATEIAQILLMVTGIGIPIAGAIQYFKERGAAREAAAAEQASHSQMLTYVQQRMLRGDSPHNAFVGAFKAGELNNVDSFKELQAIEELLTAPEVKPGDLQKFRQGDQEIAQRFNPATGAFETVGTGEAFAPPAVTNINQDPAPPAGHRWVRDAGGRITHAEVVAGTPQAREIEAANQALDEAQSLKLRSQSVVIQDIGRTLTILADPANVIGGITGRAAAINPKSAAGQASSHLETVKANVKLGKLREMRAASPTGSTGLGPLTDSEGATLETSAGNLDIGQPREQLEANLRRLHNNLQDAVHGTPEHIDALLRAGKIDAGTAAQLSFRYPLPFDAMGKPQAGAKPALTTTQLQAMSVEEIEAYYAN